jgi:integrase
LEFLILTNVRTDAVLRAAWDQFDLDPGVWTVPLSSLKDREHGTEPLRVPLSQCAVEIVREIEKHQGSDIVFSSEGYTRPLSNMAMLTSG